MITAQPFLIFAEQDDKRLSCKRWFISILVFNFNALISVVFILGLFGYCNIPLKTRAQEAIKPMPEIQAAVDNFAQSPYSSVKPLPKVQAAASKNAKKSSENWKEAKAAKYARYKISYPAEGIIHARGNVPVGNSAVSVNILEINKNINPNLDVRPEIASDFLNSRVKIGAIANKTGAIAAVNGGYFKPQTGVPLGALVINNEILTGPIYGRAAIGINADNTYSAGKTDEIKFYLKNRNYSLKIDNVNQPRMLSTYTLLYTERWGEKSPPPPKYGINALVINGKAVGFYNSSVEIPKGGIVVSGPEKIVRELDGKKHLKFKTEYPKQFQSSVHIISGGPFLIKDGEIFIDVKEEKLTSITGRNPRTLIGYTKNNELVVVTVDGRERHSVGMSLHEAARFMKRLGCYQAINLDGGSSTVMYLNGKITNRPPQEGGIPISGVLAVNLIEDELF